MNDDQRCHMCEFAQLSYQSVTIILLEVQANPINCRCSTSLWSTSGASGGSIKAALNTEYEISKRADLLVNVRVINQVVIS